MNPLKQQFSEIVQRQLADNDPPFVRTTLDRLKGLGYSEEMATHLISVCVAQEVYAVISENAPFNIERYQKMLDQLPDLPPDS